MKVFTLNLVADKPLKKQINYKNYVNFYKTI